VNTLLIVGTIIGAGYLLGELVNKVGLPRVSGYILAGLALNPGITGIVSLDFVQGTDAMTGVALAILTFAVGGTLAIAPLKELGKGIILIALGEAELAALFVVLGLMVVLPFFLNEGAGFVTMVVPLALLLGTLASPTDPSATLAVLHQYKAKGQVSFTIMATAALDDAIGIINFSVGVVIASFLVAHGHAVSGGGISALIEPIIERGRLPLHPPPPPCRIGRPVDRPDRRAPRDVLRGGELLRPRPAPGDDDDGDGRRQLQGEPGPDIPPPRATSRSSSSSSSSARPGS